MKSRLTYISSVRVIGLLIGFMTILQASIAGAAITVRF